VETQKVLGRGVQRRNLNPMALRKLQTLPKLSLKGAMLKKRFRSLWEGTERRI